MIALVKRLVAGLAVVATLAASLPAYAAVDPVARGMAASRLYRGQASACGSVALSTPCLNLTQTWNAGGVTFTGILENITDTASAAGSLLMDLQTGSVSQFSVRKDGVVNAVNSFRVGSTVYASGSVSLSGDVVLTRDAANTLALRNGVNAQAFNIYNTFTDLSNYEAGVARWSGSIFELGAIKGGSGTLRDVAIVAGGTENWLFKTSGSLFAAADNIYDIGASGANRPRSLFLGSNASVGGALTLSGNANLAFGTALIWSGRAIVQSSADGQVQLSNNAQTNNATITVGASNLLTIQGALATQVTTVSGLVACAVGTKGARSFVTDATATTFLSIVAGAGANNVPVVCNGTNWLIGTANLSPANDNLPPAYREQADRLWSAFG